MPVGQILLVGVQVTQEGIYVGKYRARYVSMGAVLCMADWLDKVVGSVTTCSVSYEVLALFLGPGKKGYVML